MPPPIRRSDVDACPGALRLHAAADGPLARVRVPGGLLTGAQLAFLGDLSASLGDGNLELTSRANIQLRALRSPDPARLAAHLSGAGLLPSLTHEVVRNIAAPPLATPTLRRLVRALDQALCAAPALAALPGRFLFAIGPVPLTADVAAVPAGDEFAILFADTDLGLRVPTSEVVPALLAAAHAFLELRADPADPVLPPPIAAASASQPAAAAPPPRPTAASPAVLSPVEGDVRGEGSTVAAPGAVAWRLAELAAGPARVAAWTAAALGRPLAAAGQATQPDSAEQAPPIGVLPQPDGRVSVGAIVPLGRLSGEQIAVLSRADRLVLTPWRGILVPDLPADAAAGWLAALADVGLPIEAASRWSGVTACAGRPGCAKSLADVRAAASAATVVVDGLPVHWIGCDRGCGSPAGAHVRVEATEAGWAVTAPGRDRDGETVAAARGTGPAETVAAARRADLAETVAAARRG